MKVAKKTKQILLRLDEEHMRILDALSREKQVSRQSIIKGLIMKEGTK